MPAQLANNILHSECGIPPVHIRAAKYMKRRYGQRFLNYDYCSQFPKHGTIRKGWCDPEMYAVRISSNEVLVSAPRFHIADSKEKGLGEGIKLIESLTTGDIIVEYVDRSNKDTSCGCAWSASRGKVELRLYSCGLPASWDIDMCELFAIFSLLRDIIALSPRSMVIFTDSQSAIKMIWGMQP